MAGKVRTTRRFARLVVAGFATGALLVASAWAGVVVDPLSAGHDEPSSPAEPALDHLPDAAEGGLERASQRKGGGGSGGEPVEELDPEDIPAVAASTPTTPPLAEGVSFLAGAARASLDPAPGVFGGPGDTWQQAGCTSIDEGHLDTDHAVASMEDLRGWPAASPDCIYLGGFGIGPARAAERVDDGGVWVRAVALSNGEATFVYAIADTVGWFARYDAAVCDDCGILDVRERLAAEVGGLDLEGVVVGSTHTHAGADTYGGWGGIPDWYRAQLRDAALAAVKQAVANLRPAELQVGEAHLRDRNGERRDSYYSTADTGATWLQAAEPGGDVIATWATFAGHPTIVGGPVLHADWPGATARHFETLFGGVGVVFEGGLGNVSISTLAGADEDEQAERTGQAVAAAVAADVAAGGTALAGNEMRAAAPVVTHPAMTNPGLVTLASAGLFDREFTPGTKGAGLPGAYSWSKQGETATTGEVDDNLSPGRLNACTSSGPTVITTAGVHRVGEFVVAFAPGEIFSNLAEVVKEELDASATTMVLGQSNDALGYIIQSFEFDELGNVATEYGTQTHEYEEVFSIDRCFGDHVLQTILDAGRTVGAH